MLVVLCRKNRFLLKINLIICILKIYKLDLLCEHNKLLRSTVKIRPIMIQNDQLTLDYYLKTAWQSIANKYNQLAMRYGITQTTGYVLIHIKKEGTPVSELAALMGVKNTSLSRILNNLEELELIYREVNHADKRSVKVFLTPKGVEKRKVAKRVVMDFNNYLEDDMTSTERETLVKLLSHINQLAVAYNPANEETRMNGTNKIN